MKLYLSSYHIPTPHDLIELVGKPAAEIRVAVIMNAKDYYAPRAWAFKAKEVVARFAALGMAADIVDLRTNRDAAVLERTLRAYDLIWATGGNTFCLRYEMRESGFEAIIRDLLEGGITYGGDSAGALVAGPSLRGVELDDEPEFAEEVIARGLGLVTFIPLPHADSPDFSAGNAYMRDIHAAEGLTMIELTNAQALVVNGDQLTVVEKTD